MSYVTRHLMAWLFFFVEMLNIRVCWHVPENGDRPDFLGLGTKNKHERNIFTPVEANIP